MALRWGILWLAYCSAETPGTGGVPARQGETARDDRARDRPASRRAVTARAALAGGLLAGLALLPAAASGADCRAIADLAGAALGAFPEAWRPRAPLAREVYRVLEEGGVRFIRGTAAGTGVQLGLELPWDLRAHPRLAWRWRPVELPRAADERDPARNDSALGVYAVFPHTAVSVRTVKYVWSLAVPAGATVSASAGLTRIVVLRSGPPAEPRWVEEAVDVARDYRRLFGEPAPVPRGIALLTDADQTRSVAIGDYAGFRVCPPAGG